MWMPETRARYKPDHLRYGGDLNATTLAMTCSGEAFGDGPAGSKKLDRDGVAYRNPKSARGKSASRTTFETLK